MHSIANTTGYRHVALPKFAGAKARVARPVSQDTVCFGEDKKKLSFIKVTSAACPIGSIMGGAFLAIGALFGIESNPVSDPQLAKDATHFGLYIMATALGLGGVSGATYLLKALKEKLNAKK